MNAAARLVEVRVPDMGNFKDVAIIDVLVKPGEKIEPEAPLVTLETEKATMDVPSTVGGVIEKIHIAKGGTVSPGDLIVTVRSEGDAAGDSGGPSDGTQPSATAMGGTGASGAGGGTDISSGSNASGTAAATSGADASGARGAGGLGTSVSGSDGSAAARGGSAAAGGTGSAGASASAGGGGFAPASGATGPDRAGVSPGAGGGSGGAGLSGGTGGPGGAGAPAGSTGGFGQQAAGATGRTSASGGPSSTGSQAVPSGTASQAAAPSLNGAPAAQGASGRMDLPPINEPGFSRAHAGPSVRKFARELGVDLTRVAGGGFKGRVTHDDVKAFVKKFLASAASPLPAAAAVPKKAPAPAAASALPSIPVIDFSQFGPTETRPLSRIQKISGPRLHASWVNIPHVTQFDEADITDLEELRGKLKDRALQANIKLTPLAFIMRACVKALQAFPLFNSSLDATGANLVLKKYIHLGFAADTPNGLVVPVVQDADRKDVYEVARHLGQLSEKARAGRLGVAEMQGGSFTISSLGGIGGTAFTPIINAPEVAILGISRSAMRPIFRDGAFVPRLILPLSLSYDHRVIDGASAARFTTFLAQTLADPRGLTEAVP